MEKHCYTVYMHKNKINGKVYIGITGRKPEDRWKNGTAYKRSRYFQNAIEKYGWDNFEHIILYSNLTQKEAEQCEIDLIKKFDSTNRDKGYNIQHGGNTVGTMSEETKKKISKANKGKPSWIKGKHHSEETKRKIGQINMKKQHIYQYNRYTGDFLNEFSNLNEASSVLGIDKNSICSVCNNRAKSIGGYIFKYKTDDLIFGEKLKLNEFEKNKNTHLRPVRQYEKDGTFIKEYPSIKDAELAFNKKQGGTLIWHCVNHKKPSALGYLWSYTNEDVVIPKSKREKAVNQYDINENFLRQFSSVKKAAQFVNVTDNTLIVHLKDKNIIPYKGYIWKYA